MKKIGIIGFGKMGRIRFDAIQKEGRGKVVAMYEPAPVSDWPEGVERYASAEAVIEAPQIEAVFICTPNFQNRPLTVAALKADKNVFCEKPPCFTSAEMREIIAVEKESGCKLMYGFNHRHHSSLRKAKEMVDSGEYGKLLWLRGRYGKSVDQDYYQDWRSHKKMAGGGILMDQGIHMLDLFLMLAGDFDEVKSFVSNLYWKLDVEDNVFAILRNRDGVVASLHSTMTQWRHLFSLEIFLEQGYVVINGLKTSSGSYGEEVMTVAKNRTTAPAATWDDEEHFHFTNNHSWDYEMGHFMSALINNTPIEWGNSQDALKLMSLLDRIYEDGKTI